jgi:calcium permeable stress-gated cation channel
MSRRIAPIDKLSGMARLGGAPTYSDAEYTAQNYYFAFQVIQVFLVATLGAAASTAGAAIAENPASVTTLLSQKLPLAYSFYLSYFVLQGLGVVSGLLVGLAGLFVTPILVKFLGSTPRKIFLRWNQLAGVGWAVVYPVMTNFFVIGKLDRQMIVNVTSNTLQRFAMPLSHR